MRTMEESVKYSLTPTLKKDGNLGPLLPFMMISLLVVLSLRR